MGQNIRRYGKVGFPIPQKERRKEIFGREKYFLQRRRKRRTIFGKGKYSFAEEKKTEKEKKEKN